MAGDKLDPAQLRRATVALLKHTQKQTSSSSKAQLLEQCEPIHLQIALRKIPERVSKKPIHLDVPHPLQSSSDCEMCLFVKDDTKPWVKQMLAEKPVEGLSKVMTLKKLRTAYKRFEQRRELVAQYDLFLCDDRILPTMAKALGSTFFKVKKQPVPVRLGPGRRDTLREQVARARDGAQLRVGLGCTWAVKLATTAMAPDAVAENLAAGAAAAVQHVPGKWANVVSMHIRTPDSVALPVYSDVGSLVGGAAPAAAAGAAAEEEWGEVGGEGGEGGSGGKGGSSRGVGEGGGARAAPAALAVQMKKIAAQRKKTALEAASANAMASAPPAALPSGKSTKNKAATTPRSKGKPKEGRAEAVVETAAATIAPADAASPAAAGPTSGLLNKRKAASVAAASAVPAAAAAAAPATPRAAPRPAAAARGATTTPRLRSKKAQAPASSAPNTGPDKRRKAA